MHLVHNSSTYFTCTLLKCQLQAINKANTSKKSGKKDQLKGAEILARHHDVTHLLISSRLTIRYFNNLFSKLSFRRYFSHS